MKHNRNYVGPNIFLEDLNSLHIPLNFKDFHWRMSTTSAREILTSLGFEYVHKSIKCANTDVFCCFASGLVALLQDYNGSGSGSISGVICDNDSNIIPSGCSRSPHTSTLGDCYNEFSFTLSEGVAKTILYLKPWCLPRWPTFIKDAGLFTHLSPKFAEYLLKLPITKGQLTLSKIQAKYPLNLVELIDREKSGLLIQHVPHLITVCNSVNRYWWTDPLFPGKPFSSLGNKTTYNVTKKQIHDLLAFAQPLEPTGWESNPGEFTASGKLNITPTAGEFTDIPCILKFHKSKPALFTYSSTPKLLTNVFPPSHTSSSPNL